MTFNLNELMVIYSEQIWVELSPEKIEQAWLLTSFQSYSNAAAYRNAYLNYLCLNTFETWLKEDLDLDENFEIGCQQADLPSLWEVVNGTGLTLGETRLALIPSEKSSIQEFRIPQEWVNIPKWAANYYLAVQLNLEENWLRVWGYATHQQIHSQGTYDPMDRTYSLKVEDLITDLNIMWVARSFYSQRKPEVKPLPSLSAAQVEKLLEQLSQWTPYSPRLDVPFETWAALLESDYCRQRLYQSRQENKAKKYAPKAVVERRLSQTNNLSLWVQNIFESGWQSLDVMLGTKPKTLAGQCRNSSEFHEVSIKAAKIIDLGMQLGGQSIVLLVAITLDMNEKVSMRVQLHPANEDTYLPSHLKLILLSQSGLKLQEVQSRCQDNYIQLKKFKLSPKTSFSIQVELNDVSIKENFAIKLPDYE